MPKVGDKYIIEIGEVFKDKGTYEAYGGEVNDYEENLYRIKGFNSLVFDDEGLRKLEKYKPKKKENEQANSPPVNIGDEVEDEFGARWFVTYVELISGVVYAVSGVGLDGHVYSASTLEIKRTGYGNKSINDALNWERPVERF